MENIHPLWIDRCDCMCIGCVCVYVFFFATEFVRFFSLYKFLMWFCSFLYANRQIVFDMRFLWLSAPTIDYHTLSWELQIFESAAKTIWQDWFKTIRTNSADIVCVWFRSEKMNTQKKIFETLTMTMSIITRKRDSIQ